MIFNKAEFSNLLRFSKRNPWVLLFAITEFVFLFLKGLINRVAYKFKVDKHGFQKNAPANFFLRELVVDDVLGSKEITLLLPQYIIKRESVSPSLQQNQNVPLSGDDIEAYYAANRWTHCLDALFKSDSEVEEAIDVCMQWISKGAPKTDRAWESYSASERVVNILVLLATRKNIVLSNETNSLVCSFLKDSLYWIDGHFEYYHHQRTNNHILNNARAIILSGVVLNNCIAVERGLLLFSKMSKVIFLENGFMRERSSHYQVIVTNWFLDSVFFAENYQGLSELSYDALTEMKVLLAKVVNATSLLVSFSKNGELRIGDVSPDTSPEKSLARLKLLYSERMGTVNHKSDVADNWFFLKAGHSSLVSNITFNKFPVRFPTHGHNDLGGFVWNHGSHPVLVDIGRYRYTKDDISLYQISGERHNTLLVNGLSPLSDSLKINGTWFPYKYADADIDAKLDGENSLQIEHTGFQRIQGVGVHKRLVKLEEHILYIEDQVEGKGQVVIDLNWHFDENYKYTDQKSHFFENGISKLFWESDTDKGILAFFTVSDYSFSLEYGQVSQAKRLNIKYLASLPIKIFTTFKIITCAE